MPPGRRAIVFLTAIVLLFGAIGWRLFELQISDHDALVARGVDQRLRTIVLAAERGVIFDRNGNELAVSIPQYTVWADPKFVVDDLGWASRLSPILGVPVDALQARLAQDDKRFVYLARQVDETTMQQVRDLDIGASGIGIVPESKRFYPQGELAAAIIGRTDIDNQGIAGLEYQYDDQLTGIPGEIVVERDQDGREIPQSNRTYTPPQRGDDLVSTIDRGLQYNVDQLLIDWLPKVGAQAITVIVMDLATGDIVAMSTVLSPEAQTAGTAAAAEAPADAPASANGGVGPEPGSEAAAPGRPRPAGPTDRNRSITDAFEPGSIMKIVPLAGALEEGLVDPEEIFSVPDQYVYLPLSKKYRKTFRDHDPHPVLPMRPADILRVSSNIGTIKVAEALGEAGLYQYINEFGLAERTGVDYPGEEDGLLLDFERWSKTTLPTNAIGQGIATTPLQMLNAYATIARCGEVLAPRFVMATIDANGQRHEVAPGSPRRVVSERTAALVNDMLVGVVDGGTGVNAAVNGYTVAGKTGTALKVLEDGTYGTDDEATHRYRSSFVGFLPAEAPRLAAIVVVDEPSFENRYASVAAAPLFSSVMSYAVRDMKVAPPPAGTRPCSGAAGAIFTAVPTPGSDGTSIPPTDAATTVPDARDAQPDVIAPVPPAPAPRVDSVDPAPVATPAPLPDSGASPGATTTPALVPVVVPAPGATVVPEPTADPVVSPTDGSGTVETAPSPPPTPPTTASPLDPPPGVPPSSGPDPPAPVATAGPSP